MGYWDSRDDYNGPFNERIDNYYMKIVKFPIIYSIVMLSLSILPIWPYGYYTLLRLVVCFTGIFLAWHSYRMQKIPWVWAMGLIALVFNPVIPLHLDRGLWLIVDIVVAVVLGVFLFKFRK